MMMNRSPRPVSSGADGGRGRRVHHARVAVEAERQRGWSVGDHVDPQQLRSSERHEQVADVVAQVADRGADDPDRDQDHEGDVGGEQESEELANVVVDPAALFDGGGDRGEVVVEQDEVCHLAADVAAALAHGDADVGSLEGRCVVDSVAGHRHDLAALLERLDECQFVVRADSGEDVDLVDRVEQFVGVRAGRARRR